MLISPNERLVGLLCLTSHRQRGHLEAAPPFTVPCKRRGARFYTVPTGNRTPSRGSPLHNRCATPAPPNEGRETRLILHH